MADLEGYYQLLTKIRKDPLGHVGFNSMIGNAELLTRFLGAEHLLTTDSGAIGEHNAPEIARCGGLLEYNAGYTLRGESSYLTYDSNPATGEVLMAVTSGKLNSGRIAVQVQNCSESGLTVPALTICEILSATSIKFYSFAMGGSLGTGNPTFSLQDASFAVMAQSDPLADTSFTALTASARRGIGLRGSSLWDPFVQRTSDLYGALDAFHNPSTGAHDDVRVPVAVAHIKTVSGTPSIVTADSIGISSVTDLGVGQTRVTLSSAVTNFCIPFVTCDYKRFDGGAATDWYQAVTPYSKLTNDDVEVYTYKQADADGAWTAADCDFWLVVHPATSS